MFQGPVGYTPTCNCMPAYNHLERQVHDTRDSVYDHINTHSRAMQERIDQVDHRASMRVHALEQYTRERFQEEENLCRQRISQRYQDESDYHVPQNENMKMQIQSWLEQKLEGYGHCLHHHHDDSALPNENIFSDVHETANGRLFRSRSDETLSQSDNHSGKGYRKREFYESRQEAMQQIRAWQVPSYSKDRNKIKILEKHRQSELDHKPQYRSHSRQQLSSQQDVSRYPIEPKIEIRNNKTNKENTRVPQYQIHNNEHLGDDSTYVTMNNYTRLGAISKPPNTGQEVHDPQYQSTKGSRGPITHSTPKSSDSSPYDSNMGMVRSKTDTRISGNSVNDITRSQTDTRVSTNVYNSVYKSETKSSVPNNVQTPMNTGTCRSVRQLFSPGKVQEKDLSYNSAISPEQTFANTQSSPLRNSTSSDKFGAGVPKPTFTTFGYDDMTDGVTAPANSPEQANGTQNRDTSVPTSSSPRCTGSHSSLEEMVKRNSIHESHQRQNSQVSTGFIPTAKDDNYMDMSYLSKPGNLHQRSRSSEGLLDDQFEPSNGIRSQSENRTFHSMSNSQSLLSQRPWSESRGNLQQSYTDTLQSRPLPQPQVPSSRTVTHPMYSSTPYNSQTAGYTRQTNRPPVAPKPSNNTYSSIKDMRYHSNQNSEQCHNVNTYTTVQDVKPKQDINQNFPVKINPLSYYYGQAPATNKMTNYSQLEPRSKNAYSTYLTGDPQYSRENSPNICNNSKEDSSSNPDSGYSSKIYGNRGATPVSAASTPSSSFSTDRGISLPSNTNSPQSQYSNTDYEGLPKTEYQDEIQNHIQSWYQRKLQETTQKVYDNWRQEKSPGKSRLNTLSRYPTGNQGNSNYAQIQYVDSRQGVVNIPHSSYNGQMGYNGNNPASGFHPPSYVAHSSDV